MARSVSNADHELTLAVADRLGAPFSPRQLARLRETGYLDPAERWSLGRGAGTASAYPSERISEVVALAHAGTRARARDEAVLIAFAEGMEGLSERAVRRAYAAYLERTQRYLRSFSDSDEPIEIAEAAGKRLAARAVRTADGRRWRKRLRGRPLSPQRELERALANLVSLLLWGRSLSAEHFGSFLAASGLEAAATDELPGFGSLVSDLKPEELEKLFSRFSLPALADLIERTTFDDLARARDQMVEIVEFLVEVGSVLGRVSESGNGFGLAEAAHVQGPVTVALLAPAVFIFEELGLPVERLLELARRFLRMYRAVHQLLRVLPRPYSRFFAPDGPLLLSRKPKYLQDAVRKRLLAALQAHPKEASILKAGTAGGN